MKLCIIAEIPEEYVKFFPKNRGGDDSSVPHITILYVGTVSDKNLNKIIKIVDSIAESFSPIKCKFGPQKSFPKGDHGTPVYVEILADKNLEKLHKDIKKNIKNADIDVEHKWDEYKPHATLKYLNDGEEFTEEIPTGDFVINNITCSIWKKDEKNNSKEN